MTHRYADLAFTDAVKAAQEHNGARHEMDQYQARFGPNNELTDREATFIGMRDSFYLSTVSETGWPYVQHRGGPAGFLKVLSPTRLAFADYRGNKQYISLGNIAGNDRCALFLMDYPRRLRLKVLGHLKMTDVADADSDLVSALRPYPYKASMERVATIDIEAFDWNCSQHITPRYSEAQVREAMAPLQVRVAELEAELMKLRAPRS